MSKFLKILLPQTNDIHVHVIHEMIHFYHSMFYHEFYLYTTWGYEIWFSRNASASQYQFVIHLFMHNHVETNCLKVNSPDTIEISPSTSVWGLDAQLSVVSECIHHSMSWQNLKIICIHLIQSLLLVWEGNMITFYSS